MSCRTWETGEGSQRLAVVRGYEVLHHLDFDVRRRPGIGKVIHLHHYSTHCLDEKGSHLYCLGTPRRDMGILPHHLPRDPALLPAGPRNLDAYFDYQWRGNLCGCRHLCHNRARRYSINNRNRLGIGRCACSYAMEHADEEAGEIPGFWSAIVRVNCIGHHHGQDSLRQQIRRGGQSAM